MKEYKGDWLIFCDKCKKWISAGKEYNDKNLINMIYKKQFVNCPECHEIIEPKKNAGTGCARCKKYYFDDTPVSVIGNNWICFSCSTLEEKAKHKFSPYGA